MEISLHALCDGRTARLFPTAQDHKRIGDNDTGPNTGGMGAYSPAPFLTDAELAEVGGKILAPWLKGCQKEGIDFCGILYPGVMLTKDGPKVLEFNARFGDPETQAYLMRLENDLTELLEACVERRLDKMALRWRPEASVCVVMASAGYPGAYAKGKPIRGLAEADQIPDTKVFPRRHDGAGWRPDRDERRTGLRGDGAGGGDFGATGARPGHMKRCRRFSSSTARNSAAILRAKAAWHGLPGSRSNNAAFKTLINLNTRNFVIWFFLTATIGNGRARQRSAQKFDEVCTQLLRSHLEGVSQPELDQAALKGLLEQLPGQVMLVEDASNGAATACRPTAP